MRLKKNLHWLLENPIAHRGLHDTIHPENSLGAIARAAESGFPVEVDVQATRDGNAVVFHDWELGRLTGKQGLVKDHSWDALRRLALAGSSFCIPSLGQALERLEGRSGLVVEIKNRSTAGTLERAIAAAIQATDTPVAVMSFNVASVVWFRRFHPEIPCGQLACRFDTDPMPSWKKFLLSRYAFWVRPDFAGHRWQDLPARSLFGRPLGIPVLAWTVRSPREEHQARLHADNIIFEGYHPNPKSPHA